MRKFLIAAAGFIFFLAVFYLLPEAEAAPAFARQTGLACNTCHFQHFPTLNAFGRAFKAGGYTQVGGQSMVEGDFLSIPATLNATLVTKIRYQRTNGDDETEPTNKGELQFPDEAAILIGGRAGEHVGFLAEVSAIGTADTTTGNFSLFTGYKMPIVYTVSNTNVMLIPFSTDGQGAAYGFELLNTGSLRLQRPLENNSGRDMSAQQYIGT
ncbi:MAG: hypothetical protein HZB21_04795, partial [Deltaproteobacteria bacterium]|nr:hypothetical protein [Deltaproteobacteria bacterium]